MVKRALISAGVSGGLLLLALPVLAQSDSAMMMDVNEMTRRMMGPLIGGVMAHAWIDVVAFLIAIPIFMKLRGGRLAWPFAIIGLTELAVALLMFSGQPMWIASTVRSSLILLMTLWFWRAFR